MVDFGFDILFLCWIWCLFVLCCCGFADLGFSLLKLDLCYWL